MKHWKQDPQFVEFWTLYPRRDTTPRIDGAKKTYEKVLRVIRDGEATWEEILEGVRSYALCDRVTGKEDKKFIKMPITWVNNACWEDEYEPAPVSFEQKTPSAYTEEDWRQRLGDVNHPFRIQNFSAEKWSDYLGPRPPHPDSIVPPVIQDEYRKWWPDLRVVEM